MQSPSKVARCLDGTLLISWNIPVDPPNVRVERSHGDHYPKAFTVRQEKLSAWRKALACGHEACD